MVKREIEVDEYGSWIWKDDNAREPNLVLFIHGYTGHPEATWAKFPSLIRQVDQGFDSGFDVASFGYESHMVRNSQGIADIAGRLLTFIDAHAHENKNVFIIAHSLGGLVTRRFLIETFNNLAQREFFKKIRDVHFIGVPHMGASRAPRALQGIRKINPLAAELRRNSPVLLDILRAWDTVVKSCSRGKIALPKIFNYVGNHDWLAPMKQVIGEFNAQESVRIVAGSHISIAKPHNSENDLYKLVTRNILSSAETLATTGDLPPAPYHARLVVKADDDGYNAQWVEPEETDSFSLILPLTAEDMAELRWYLETYLQFPGAGDYVRAHGIEAKFESWGQNLSEAIFVNRAGRKIRDGLMKAANAHSSSLLTIGASDPSVLGQPWEMMRDETAPLTFQGVTIRRQLETSSKVNKFDMKPPLRVLLIVSRPSDIGFIDPRNSIAPLLDALDALPPGQVSVDFCDPPTLAELEERISQARRDKLPYHIVHFDGHGTYVPQIGVGALAFEKDDATTELVTGAQLGEKLVRLEVPLVLLEACRGSDLSDKEIYGSVAPALIKSGVGSVIAFSHSVHVEAARLLVERFYQALVDGLTIGQSLEEARAKLNANRKRWLHQGPNPETIELQDLFIPQLYQVGDDLALFPGGHSAVSAATSPVEEPVSENGTLEGFPLQPMYRFHGRAMEMLQLERDFRNYPFVLLSGMGGMGKTALAREAAAWWLRKGRFDSAVFCSFEQKVEADRVVQLIGKALEGESFSSRLAEDQWATAVRLFHQRKVLLVWDNFESTLPIFQNGQPPSTDKETTDAVESPLEFGAEERGRLQRLYRELTDGSPEGRLLVTCRPANTNLPAIKELALEGLARPDSLHLLAAVTGLKNIATDRPGCDRTEIDALLDALDDHPLSIQLVAPHLEKMTPARIRSEFGTLLSRFADENVDEPRNRSSLASMEFSKTRLSEAAQKVLPYLAWFEGGVFEQFLLDFAELEAGTWEPIRSELVATALVSVDEDIQISDPPYLRFHPTLRYAATTEQVPDREAAERRFIGVYRSVAGAANQALRGNQPANGMALLAREEANLRIAIDRAFRRGDRQEGGNMADTLRIYLESAGRLRERDALVAWVRGQLSEGGELDGVTSGSIRQHAWSLLTQGHAAEAIQMVKTLITRLETEDLAGGADPTFQLAVSQAYLGRIYYTSGHNNLALAPLQMAITRFEQLGHDARDNVSATLGSLANAYSSLGQLDRALEVAERGLAIRQELGNQREIATGLGRTAQILMAQQRYSEADARYTEAFEAAEAAGDLGVQGSLLQHQGSLQDEMGNLDRSIELYKEAITLFQRATNRGAEMRTCNQLATAERALGHLDAAEAWYARSRELAKQLNDKPQLAVVAQNTGILYQTQAENEGDPVKQAVLLSRAVDSVEESLDIKLDMENQLAAAASYGQLGILQRMLGNLGLAEENARMSLGIYESLDLPNVSLNYRDLAEIARQRGDHEAAAQWQAKYEAKEAELERLRRGQDPDSEAGEEAEQ